MARLARDVLRGVLPRVGRSVEDVGGQLQPRLEGAVVGFLLRQPGGLRGDEAQALGSSAEVPARWHVTILRHLGELVGEWSGLT